MPVPGSSYECECITLQPDEVLFLYTDGVTEAKNPRDELFGEGRLLGSLRQSVSGDLVEMIHAIRDEVQKHADGAPQFDDVTIMAINYRGQTGQEES